MPHSTRYPAGSARRQDSTSRAASSGDSHTARSSGARGTGRNAPIRRQETSTPYLLWCSAPSASSAAFPTP